MKKLIKTHYIAAACLLLALSISPAAAAAENGAALERISRVTSRLWPGSGPAPRVMLRPGIQASAYVMPDNSIVISEGLASAAAEEDELAFVVAHEISHIVSMDHSPGPAPGFAGNSDNSNLQLGEIRADASAVYLMRQAGYRPEASIRILGKLSSAGVNLRPRMAALRQLLGVID